MPTVSAIFSGGMSVGLLAGVVSGIFYLVVAGIRWAGRMRAAREREQRRRLQRSSTQRTSPEPLAADSHDDADDGEVKQQSEEWLFRQVQRRLHLQPAAATCICSADDGVGMDPETAHVREFIERLVESLVSGELDNVCIKRLHSHTEYDRMFACHHGPLCEALARLSFALQMAMANKHMAGHDSPSAAHAALKQLIHQIIQEAMALPKFKGVKPVDDMKSWEDMSSKTYEDILATAILNKVIERYQQSGSVARGSMDGNSNLLSPELMSLVAMHQPKQLTSGESGLHSPKDMNDHRYFLNDGDTLSELSNTDPLSVTIEECIEEVTTFSNAEDDDAGDSDSGIPGLNVFKKRRAPFPEYGRDIIDGPPIDVSDDAEEDEEQEESEDEASLQPTDVINPVDSWEENWLFQKRRLRVGGVQQPMPVPMLVPNPSEDYRALIGDRDAEDVSDLSDCSDGALEDLVLAEDSVTTPDREVIPPSDMTDAADKNLVENGLHGSNIGSLELKGTNTQKNLGIAEKPLIVLNDADQELSDDVSDLTEAKNMEYLKANSDDCMSEFGQQEGEYTEDYAAVTQRRQMDSLTETSDADSQEVPELPSTPIPQLSSETSSTESVAAILDSLAPGELIPQESSDLEVINNDLVQPPRPGTIAEREHKKWETAPPLPNNPYSPENIIKRLNKKHTFVRTNSGSDASIEFPELKEVDSKEKVSPPLQVVCSPSDVDCKRYGRDYYINAEPMINGKKRQSSSESYNPEDAHEVSNSNSPQNRNLSSDSLDSKEINNIESKVANWQKEINQADQYYKNMLNKKQELVPDTSPDNPDNITNTQFRKLVLKYDDCDSSSEITKTTKKPVKERQQDLKKKENISFVAMEKFVTETETKSDLRNKKLDIYPDTLDLPQGHLGNIIQNYENGIDTYSNGYSRSNSPSGSSILTSDSEYNMPSVRELTKRFAGLNQSDSSASTSKSVSPAPPVSRGEKLSNERNEDKQEMRKTRSSMSPPRPVREVHSLTARSISREFREELRHNHPVPLIKNVYKQSNSSHSSGSNNGLVEENSTSSNASLSSPPRSPLPHRSMQSSIAFWEKMKNNKS